MDLGRRYRSIYLAGATFNLLPDDESAERALERIAAHLESGGSALIPLFVPQRPGESTVGNVHPSPELTRPGSGTLARRTAGSPRESVWRYDPAA